MSYNGSGTFQINSAGQPVVSGTVISSTAFNALTADLATGLSTCITKDGQTTVTANIPMGNNKITGLAVGTAATDAANLSQVQSTAAKLINSISGADTVTGVLSPTLGAYAAGQMFYWVAAGDNTGAVTLNIDSLGAKSVTRDGSVALAAGDIKSGEVVVVVYDGTRFQVVSQLNSAGDARFANVSIASTLYVGGVATFTSGTAAAPAITTAGDTNTGIFFPAADTIAFAEGGAEALRIDSSANVGIGTSSPGYKLDVNGQARLGGSTGLVFGVGTAFAASQAEVYSTSTTPMGLGTTGAAVLRLYTNSTLQATLDTSGNLGLGVTPSAGVRLDVASASTTQLRVQMTGQADVRLISDTGYGALSNDSNMPMIFRTNATERARISSGGVFRVNTTTSSYSTANAIMDVNGGSTAAAVLTTSGGATYANLYCHNTATSGDNTFIDFGTEGTWTSRGSITYNRPGGVVAYNTTSDYRSKDVYGPIQNPGETIDALKIYRGKMKGATIERPMMIAHEAQEVVPYAVSGEKDAVNEDGTPKYQTMDHQILVPLLIAELQSLRKRVAELEAK